MQKIAKFFLIILWLMSFSIAFLWIYSKTPVLWLINLPDPAYVWLMRTFDVRGAEDAADVLLLIVLGSGFVFASIFLALF